MSVFEYVSVMVGVVLALSVSYILTFIATSIANPERVKRYWLHTFWVILLFALNLNAWILLWSMHSQIEFPVWKLLAMMTTAALIFIVSRILVPELLPDKVVDLREHLVKVRKPFFSTLSLVCILPVLRGLTNGGGSPLDPINITRSLMLVLAVSGMFIKRPGWLVWLALLWSLPLFGGLLLFWGSLK